MVVHIKEVLKDLLINSTWIDDISREKAIKKLDALKSLVVFPTYIESANDLDAYYDYVCSFYVSYNILIIINIL